MSKTQLNMVALVGDLSKEGTQYPEPKWVREASQEELFSAFEDFEEEAQQLFKVRGILCHLMNRD